MIAVDLASAAVSIDQRARHRVRATAIVVQAVRDLYAARGATAPAALPPETSLTALPEHARLELVERVETALDGRVSTRLGTPHHRTLGELRTAVEQALAARPCPRCHEPRGVDACVYCPPEARR